MRLLLFLFVFTLALFKKTFLLGNEERLKQEAEKLESLFAEYAKFYELPIDVGIKDITDELLQSPLVEEAQKDSIRQFDRRIFVFTYPSDGLKIKGLISYIPDFLNQPLLVSLRGGNGLFGIFNPGNDLMCFEQYTVISTTYRGGVSEGEDEFGGSDVNDVKNLIDFIPELEKELNLEIQKQKKYLLGSSRGGMQMFLTLARFPELQAYFSKVVSLSGILDMRQCIAFRSDMEEMFIENFGLVKGMNDNEWINQRDPLLTVDRLQAELPILIIQGTEDIRVSLAEGYHMVSKLEASGKNVTYWEMKAANHCLKNIEKRTDLIQKWLEE